MSKYKKVEAGGGLKISDLKHLAEDNNLQAIATITVAQDGTVSVVSYGSTKRNCSIIGKWAQGLWNNVISSVPFRTLFGWGNNGVPHPLTEEEIIEAGYTVARIKQMEDWFTDGHTS